MNNLANISQFESLGKQRESCTIDNSNNGEPVWDSLVADPEGIREDAVLVSRLNDPSSKIEELPLWLHVEFRDRTDRYLPHHRGEEDTYIEEDALCDEIKKEPPGYYVELEEYARARAPLYEKWLKRSLASFDKVTKECLRIANVVEPIPYVDEVLGKPRKDEKELRDRFTQEYRPWGYPSYSLSAWYRHDRPSTIKGFYEQLERKAADKVEKELNEYMKDGELLPFLDYLEQSEQLRFMPDPDKILQRLREDDRFGSVADADQLKYLKEDVTQYLDKQSKSVLGRLKNLLSGKKVDYGKAKGKLRSLLGGLRDDEDYVNKLLHYRGTNQTSPTK